MRELGFVAKAVGEDVDYGKVFAIFKIRWRQQVQNWRNKVFELKLNGGI